MPLRSGKWTLEVVMRVSKCLGLLAIGLLLGGTALAQEPEIEIYVSYPDGGGVYSWNGSLPLAPVPGFAGTGYEDVVVGPDDSPFACNPTANDLQCGWYTEYGDLIVTEKDGTGIYVYPATQPSNAYPLVDLGSDGLEGVTQAANGDLLVVDRAGGRVIRVPFDVNAQYPYGDALGWFDTDNVDYDLLTGLDDPVGIARSSRGDIFVTTDDGVITFGEVQVPDPNDPDYPKCLNPRKAEYPCDMIWEFGSAECPVLDLDRRKGKAYFLEFDADDVLYIAATDKFSSKVFSYDHYADGANCNPELIFEIDDNDIALPLVGLAVPYGDLVDGYRATLLGGEPIADDVHIENFYDHAYEFRFEPYSVDNVCSVEISALEVDPGVLTTLLESALDPEADPPVLVTGEPVIYAGENGRGIAYEVVPVGYDGTPGSGDLDCYSSEPNAILFRHSINAYTGYVPNPRIVRCDYIDPVDGGNECSLIPLNTYYPFNGIFPDDGRITGTRGSTPSDFSWYFLADVDLEDNDTGNGEFCGFESPWFEPPLPTDEDGNIIAEWTDSDILEYYTAADFPAFSTTESVPFKFYIADVDNQGTCESGGPWIDGAIVLMSVARVRDENYQVLDPFEPVLLYSAGGSAEIDPAIFNEAGLPTTQYHFNAKFTGFAPGIYQFVLVPLTNNFAAEIRYVRVY